MGWDRDWTGGSHEEADELLVLLFAQSEAQTHHQEVEGRDSSVVGERQGRPPVHKGIHGTYRVQIQRTAPTPSPTRQEKQQRRHVPNHQIDMRRRLPPYQSPDLRTSSSFYNG